MDIVEVEQLEVLQVLDTELERALVVPRVDVEQAMVELPMPLAVEVLAVVVVVAPVALEKALRGAELQRETIQSVVFPGKRSVPWSHSASL